VFLGGPVKAVTYTLGVERKSYSEGRIFDLSRQTGRSPPTLRRWARTGLDLDNPKALKAFLERMDSRKPPVDRAKNRSYSRVRNQPAQPQVPLERPSERSDEHGNGEVAVQKTGAAFALKRLELEESQAFARLQRALASGNQLGVEQCQLFWVRLVESLRKLDLSIELGRRDLEEMVPKRLACDVALAIADWLRISFAVFLSSEARPLMGIREVGEWKAYAIERFRSILHLTVHNSLSTNSPIPDWAAQKVKESWNVQ
jgi:hypothetical protein